jgi:hypothetical protein
MLDTINSQALLIKKQDEKYVLLERRNAELRDKLIAKNIRPALIGGAVGAAMATIGFSLMYVYIKGK